MELFASLAEHESDDAAAVVPALLCVWFLQSRLPGRLDPDGFRIFWDHHLNTNGIIQVWFPDGELAIVQAVVRSVCNSFPNVRCFGSLLGQGIHTLAPMQPIETGNGVELAAQMPESAKNDPMGWTSGDKLADNLAQIVSPEIPVSAILTPDPRIQITDDRPFNEHFLLRRNNLFQW